MHHGSHWWSAILLLCVGQWSPANDIVAMSHFHANPIPDTGPVFDCRVSPEEVAALLKNLESPCEHTRKSAARRLGNVRIECHPEIECALAQSAASDPSSAVRLTAIRSLTKTRAYSPETIATLESVRCNDDSSLVRLAAKLAIKSSIRHPNPVSDRPFIQGKTLFEPKIRDIRYVPASTTLPGSAFNTYPPETLPVLPDYDGSHFRIPLP